MRVPKTALQYFENRDAEIFSGGHGLSEFSHDIQILEMKVGEHFPFHKAVEIGEIANHAGALVNGAADGDFQSVIVAVTVRIVALAVDSAVFVGRHLCTVQPMRGREAIAASEMGNHC